MTDETAAHPSRRQFLAGTALAGTALAGTAVAGSSLLTACGDDGGGAGVSTERRQTLFLAGLQWGPVANFNPLSPTAGWPCLANNMQLIYEALFGFDLRDGSLKPNLGASLTQPDAKTIVIKMQPDARWQDGRPVTADDVVYTFDLGKRVKDVYFSSAWEYLAGVTRTDAQTVTFALNPDRPNPGMAKTAICQTYILPAHIWTELEKSHPKIIEYPNMQPLGSGPYKVESQNAQQVVFVRNDDYWGRTLRGKLPAPRKIVHPIFKDNAAGNLAFERNEVDVMQQFTPAIWKMWEEKKLPVKTWFDKAPFYIPGSMPMLTINTTRPGLDNPKVRRALAHTIDFARIAETAMSRYSEPAKASLILPSEAERQFLDEAAVASAGWRFDPARAREILEGELGARKGGDGVYTLPGGTRLGPWTVQTPNGWSDWQAAVSVVVEGAKAAGFDVKANFPEANTLTPQVQTGNYDLACWYIGASTTSATPWARYRDVMDLRGTLPVGQNSFHNYGRFSDARVPALLDKAATASGEELVETLKQLDVIFRETGPMIPLMYRPLDFFEINEKTWTGFPTSANPKAPPTFSGAGYLWLYEISPK